MALPADSKIILYPEYRCRICLEATNGKIALNQTINYKKAEILLNELLEYCVNAQVCENGKADGLCLACTEKGIVCYEFKKKFEESQSILLKEIEEGNRFVIKTEEDLKEEDLLEITENEIIKEEILDDDVLQVATEHGVIQEEILEDDVLVVATENGVLQQETLDDDVLVVTTENGVLQKEISDEDVLTENDEISKEEILRDKVKITENIKCHEDKQDILNTPGDKPTAKSFKGKKYCDICDIIFKHRTGIIRHRVREQSKKVSKHKCVVCGETFTFRASLIRHQLEHPPPEQSSKEENTAEFKCEFCEKIFKLRRSLVKHPCKHRQNVAVDRKQMPCPTCGKIYFKKYTLNAHIMTHSGEKPFTCEVCGLGFTYPSNLSKHRLIHSGEKPYKCSECGQGFVLKGTLDRHLLVHSKKRDNLKWEHVCYICGAIYGSANTLTVHMKKTHSAERPYKCTICSQSFYSSTVLRDHIVLHTGV